MEHTPTASYKTSAEPLGGGRKEQKLHLSGRYPIPSPTYCEPMHGLGWLQPPCSPEQQRKSLGTFLNALSNMRGKGILKLYCQICSVTLKTNKKGESYFKQGFQQLVYEKKSLFPVKAVCKKKKNTHPTDYDNLQEGTNRLLHLN